MWVLEMYPLTEKTESAGEVDRLCDSWWKEDSAEPMGQPEAAPSYWPCKLVQACVLASVWGCAACGRTWPVLGPVAVLTRSCITLRL